MKQQGSELSQNPIEPLLTQPNRIEEKNQAQLRQTPLVQESLSRLPISPSNNIIAADGEQEQVHGAMTQIQSNPQQPVGIQPQRSPSEGSMPQPQQVRPLCSRSHFYQYC